MMKLVKSSLMLMLTLLLFACEKTPIEKSGIVIDDDMPKDQRILVQMLFGEPLDYAEENLKHGNHRLFAYYAKDGMKIPAVAMSQLEDYAVKFGVMMVPAMQEAVDENHKKLQAYFLEYALVYNQAIIRAGRSE